MNENTAQKKGYLQSDFRIFHLKDEIKKEFEFHYHDFNKILIFISGNVTYNIEGKNYKLAPFDIVLVRAGEIHRPVIQSDCIYERIIIYTSDQFLASYQTSTYDLASCFHQAMSQHCNVLRMAALQNSQLYQCVERLEKSFIEKDYADELNKQILFLEFLIQLNRAVLHNRLTYLSISACNSKIQDIINYINQNLTSDLSIDSLASQFYISKYYLMHTFHSESGYSIGSYISTKRLLLARDLIANGSSVTDSCYQCGYQNYSTFSRAFRKQFGASPRDYFKDYTEK